MKTAFHAILLAFFPCARLACLPTGRPSDFPSFLCVFWPSFRNALWERGIPFARNREWRYGVLSAILNHTKPAELKRRLDSGLMVLFHESLLSGRLARLPHGLLDSLYACLLTCWKSGELAFWLADFHSDD